MISYSGVIADRELNSGQKTSPLESVPAHYLGAGETRQSPKDKGRRIIERWSKESEGSIHKWWCPCVDFFVLFVCWDGMGLDHSFLLSMHSPTPYALFYLLLLFFSFPSLGNDTLLLC